MANQEQLAILKQGVDRIRGDRDGRSIIGR